MGREFLHKAIKDNAISVADDLRKGKITKNNLAQKIAQDERIPLNLKQILSLLENKTHLKASAPKQVETFISEVAKWTQRFPEAKEISPKLLI